MVRSLHWNNDDNSDNSEMRMTAQHNNTDSENKSRPKLQRERERERATCLHIQVLEAALGWNKYYRPSRQYMWRWM